MRCYGHLLQANSHNVKPRSAEFMCEAACTELDVAGVRYERIFAVGCMLTEPAYNAFMDVYLILIALRYYGTLQMPLKNRVRVCCQTVIGSAV
jgi:hypothetical protein